MRDFNPDDFIIRYPGIFDEREKPYMDQYLKDIEAINNRGPVDLDLLVTGQLPPETPGIWMCCKATEEMIRYNHAKYEQENPLFNDPEYARAAGFKDIPAYFTYAASDDAATKAFPPEARDTLLVSQLSHSIKHFAEIYPGDTLFTVIDRRDITDITPPEGSIYRTVSLYCELSVFNQRKELVNTATFSFTESVKTYKPGRKPEPSGNPFKDTWEDPDWFMKPDHQYTDDDYEYMKSVWRAEKIRGARPLYWEDVNIGDEPQPILEGPIIDSVLPTVPYAQGLGGTRTPKKELLDPEIAKTFIKNSHGILMPKNIWDITPKAPKDTDAVFMNNDGREKDFEKAYEELDTAQEEPLVETGINTEDIHKTEDDARAAILNFYGRDLCIRHINAWMGDKGFIKEIKWSIMPPETHAAFGKPVPVSPAFHHYLQSAPKMKDRTVNSHGLTRDTAEVHSVVVDKYYKNGEFLVKLIWWINDIQDTIWIDGEVEVKLPSRNC